MKETKANPYEIRIPQIARIEGHGNIVVEIQKDKVKSVKLNIPEGPRLFETLVIGKTPAEATSIVPRICAICSVSHRYAAIRAFERALGYKVTKETHLLRTLMHYGEMIESHALHAFVLALPDFLNYPSAIAMTDRFAPQVLKALKLKKFGNYIMEITTARYTHGENPTVGGFGKVPEISELIEIKTQAEKLIPDAEELVELMRSLEYPTAMEDGMVFMCLKPPGDKYGFVGDKVLISTGEEVPIDRYLELTNERVVEHSTAKRCRYKERPYVVGAIARMNLLGERLRGKAGEAFRRCYSLSWIRNPLYNNLAQAIEILFVLEDIPEIVNELLAHKDTLAQKTKILKAQTLSGKNVGAVEAPRGTLYHYYEVTRGIVSGANLVIPTTQNLDAIETHLRIAATNLLNTTHDRPFSKLSPEERADIERILEMVVRAYDPCISCSVHLVDFSS
ncbi:MAG: Ni/Fe hydrogenase subunit alpha [candidate division WOR-3 bacterium]|nr:Ni/Fe hydrogenase subunit alpha [candidate division WOR-3 bacterium]MCX7757336.1 Ni/Fe hydrogenase subunit alpha [candidate division WOR-3 bacterium]MDW7988430.1 Ni/Fe hydrogenase subunit alpha [candidate division WOR-3 bacterium]